MEQERYEVLEKLFDGHSCNDCNKFFDCTVQSKCGELCNDWVLRDPLMEIIHSLATSIQVPDSYITSFLDREQNGDYKYTSFESLLNLQTEIKEMFDEKIKETNNS